MVGPPEVAELYAGKLRRMAKNEGGLNVWPNVLYATRLTVCGTNSNRTVSGDKKTVRERQRWAAVLAAAQAGGRVDAREQVLPERRIRTVVRFKVTRMSRVTGRIYASGARLARTVPGLSE